MASRIELRKEQQRVLASSAKSLGFLSGEGVVSPQPRWDQVWLEGSPGRVGYLQLSTGALVRGVRVVRSENETFQAIDVSSNSDVASRLTLSTAEDSVRQWEIIAPLDSATIEPTPATNIDQIYITLASGVRERREVTYDITGPNTYTATFGAQEPVWELRPSGRQLILSANQKVLGVYSSYEETDAVIDALRAINTEIPFGNALVNQYNLNLNPASTKRREFGKLEVTDDEFIYGVIVQDGKFYLFWLALSRYQGKYGVRYQVSGWEPSEQESRIGSPPDQTTEFIPQNLSVKFHAANDSVIETQTVVVDPEISQNQTHFFSRKTALTTTTPKVVLDVGEHTAWLREAIVPKTNRIENVLLDTYQIEAGFEEDVPIQIFAHAAPIDVPSIATLAGSRPNEYLTYSGSWDGSTFQKMRCRCPAWILYHVLTAERFGIELSSSRINTQSFLTTSKYCQGLINSKPRWTYDGILSGTQDKIIRDLLNLMRGWLRNDVDGRLSLKIEQPEEAKWIICPAVIGQGRIDYRRSLDRPTVRCTYTDRLTGQDSVTEDLDNARIVEVPWQDPDVAKRWADWETFSDQNLLNTVEFTLPWRYHTIGIGDLIDLYDPQHIGLRPAGRILDFDATGKWVQLDGVPNYWPDKEAGASLKDYGRKTVINPDVWGFSTFSFTGANPPSIQIQTEDGGYTSHAIKEVMFSAGGRPEQNRVILDTFPTNIEDRATWAISGKIDGDAIEDIHPTKWRVQSVSENVTGREYRVVCTRYINGMHKFIEAGNSLIDIKTKWKSKCGTNLSQYDGFFNDLEQRYPADNTNPFDLSTTFSNLPSSCVV